MTELIEFLHHEVLTNAATFGVVMFECIGVGITLWTGLRALFMLLGRAHGTGIYLAKGLSMGLMFKMGGEILRTVTAHDMSSIVIVGATMLVRAAMSLLLHWEMAQEEKHEHEHEPEEEPTVLADGTKLY